MKKELVANIADIKRNNGTKNDTRAQTRAQTNNKNNSHHPHTHSLFKKQEIRPCLRRNNDNGQRVVGATQPCTTLQQHLQVTRGRDVREAWGRRHRVMRRGVKFQPLNRGSDLKMQLRFAVYEVAVLQSRCGANPAWRSAAVQSHSTATKAFRWRRGVGASKACFPRTQQRSRCIVRQRQRQRRQEPWRRRAARPERLRGKACRT